MSRSSPVPPTKIGIFGGTFDPIHHGHLIVAEWIWGELHLDKVFFVPLFKHPFQEKSDISPAHHRFRMVDIAIERYEYFKISKFEVTRETPSYTIDTLRHFKKEFPDARLYFFIGGDNLEQFHLWKDYRQLLEMAQFVVYDRPGGHLPEHLPGDKFLFVKAPMIELSSTLIRQRIKEGKPVQSMLPMGVWSYILVHKLYQR